MASGQLVVGFRAYRGERQRVLLEAAVANLGEGAAHYVTLDVRPEEGEPGSLSTARLAGRSVLEETLSLDLGREVPDTISVGLFYADAQKRPVEMLASLSIDTGGSEIAIQPAGPLLSDLLRQQGVAAADWCAGFTVVPFDLAEGEAAALEEIDLSLDEEVMLGDSEDSGLSLDEPLELACDDESPALGEDDTLTLSESPAPELQADDDFLLTPLDAGPDEEDSESGSQVIALEDAGDEAATMVAGEGMAAMLDEEVGGVGMGLGVSPLEPGLGLGAPLGGQQPPAAAPPEAVRRKPPKEEHRRWTDVSFPSEVPVGDWQEMSVAVILKERTLEDGRVVQVARPHAHDQELILQREAGETMIVDVVVSAPGYRIDGDWFACIEVPHNADSRPVTFRLCAMETGLKAITVNFYQKKRYIGTVQLEVDVVAEGEQPSDERAKVKAALDFSGVGEAPDLTLNVSERPLSDGATELRFTLISPLEELGLQDGGSVLLRQDPAQWIDQALSSIEKLLDTPTTRELAERRIASIGYHLYDQLFPPRLKELFWSSRDRLNSLMVVSEEPWIPWEMVRPHRRTNGDEVTCAHLCEEFLFSRWLAGRPLAGQLSGNVGRIVAVEEGTEAPRVRDIVVHQRPPEPPPPPAGSGDLPSVGRELDMFRGLGRHGLEVAELSPTLRSLLRAFEDGGFDILHFACHGAYNRTSPDHSMLQLTDGQLCPEDLTGPQVRFAEARPMVFLNACHTGRTGHALTRIGSWASRFIQSGCGAFVGSFWAVEDEPAYRFAQSFYEGLFTGLPAGEAFRRARQSIKRPDSTTWMAFCLYADPHAVLESPREAPPRKPHRKEEQPREASAEERFEEALRKRRLREALEILSQIADPLRASLSRNRWRWAMVNEISALARKITLHLNRRGAYSALKVWEPLKELLALDPQLATQAKPALGKMAEMIILAACNGIRIAELHEMVAGCAEIPGVEDSIKKRAATVRGSLDDIVGTLDKVNQPPPSGMLARRSHRKKVRKTIQSLSTRRNLPPDWIEKALVSQIDRWPNVLETLDAKRFAKHEHLLCTNRGLRLLGEGNCRAAAEDFLRAIELKPKSAAAHNNYAWVFVVSDDPQFSDLEEAIKYARKAVELSPRAGFLDTLAELERKRGNLDAAIAAMQQAMEKDQIEPDRWAEKLEELLAEKEAKLGSP